MQTQLFVAAVCLFSSVVVAHTVHDCPSSLQRDEHLKVFGDSCFRFDVDEKREFQDAQRHCQEYGGNLALVKSESVNNFIKDVLRERNDKAFKSFFWIGLKFKMSSFNYTWVDKTSMDYNGFMGGDGLNAVFVADDLCVCLNINMKFWHTIRCESSHNHFICQYPITISSHTNPDAVTMTSASFSDGDTPSLSTTPKPNQNPGTKPKAERHCPKSLDGNEYNVKMFGDKCYRFELNKYTTFDTAQEHCQQDGGHLAVASSQKIDYFIKDELMKNADMKFPMAWIGLRYDVANERWSWIDGTTFRYKNFRESTSDINQKLDSSVPNQQQQCVTLDYFDGKWDVYPCTDDGDVMMFNNMDSNLKHPFVCEYDLVTFFSSPSPHRITTTSAAIVGLRNSTTFNVVATTLSPSSTTTTTKTIVAPTSPSSSTTNETSTRTTARNIPPPQTTTHYASKTTNTTNTSTTPASSIQINTTAKPTTTTETTPASNSMSNISTITTEISTPTQRSTTTANATISTTTLKTTPSATTTFSTHVTLHECPSDIKRDEHLQAFQNNCYRFQVNEKRDFQNAQRYCQANGGNLALLKSASINKFLTDVLSERYEEASESPFWIGLSFQLSSARYTWVDGFKMSYNDFEDGDEFNEVFVADDLCVGLNSSVKFWHDFSCDSKHHFICEYPISHTHLTTATTYSDTLTQLTTKSDRKPDINTTTTTTITVANTTTQANTNTITTNTEANTNTTITAATTTNTTTTEANTNSTTTTAANTTTEANTNTTYTTEADTNTTSTTKADTNTTSTTEANTNTTYTTEANNNTTSTTEADTNTTSTTEANNNTTYTTEANTNTTSTTEGNNNTTSTTEADTNTTSTTKADTNTTYTTEANTNTTSTTEANNNTTSTTEADTNTTSTTEADTNTTSTTEANTNTTSTTEANTNTTYTTEANTNTTYTTEANTNTTYTTKADTNTTSTTEANTNTTYTTEANTNTTSTTEADTDTTSTTEANTNTTYTTEANTNTTSTAANTNATTTTTKQSPLQKSNATKTPSLLLPTTENTAPTTKKIINTTTTITATTTTTLPQTTTINTANTTETTLPPTTATTTIKTTTTTVEDVTCESIVCDLDCDLNGYIQDPITGCMVCECNS